ncbi:MAG: hypothetical protein FWE37_04995 [Spirochaetaceae bacterium]|nr:hypothetical protein [Spirochaetaceae bacterium]
MKQAGKTQDLLQKLPKEGFIKIGVPDKAPDVSAGDKVALLRKGNILFNEGNIELASKIFLNLNYTDGIVRVGDYYYNKHEYIKAINLFKAAKDEGRVSKTAKKMADVLSGLLAE